MLKSLDKQLLCELLLNNVFCLAFSSNFILFSTWVYVSRICVFLSQPDHGDERLNTFSLFETWSSPLIPHTFTTLWLYIRCVQHVCMYIFERLWLRLLLSGMLSRGMNLCMHNWLYASCIIGFMHHWRYLCITECIYASLNNLHASLNRLMHHWIYLCIIELTYASLNILCIIQLTYASLNIYWCIIEYTDASLNIPMHNWIYLCIIEWIYASAGHQLDLCIMEGIYASWNEFMHQLWLTYRRFIFLRQYCRYMFCYCSGSSMTCGCVVTWGDNRRWLMNMLCVVNDLWIRRHIGFRMTCGCVVTWGDNRRWLMNMLCVVNDLWIRRHIGFRMTYECVMMGVADLLIRHVLFIVNYSSLDLFTLCRGWLLNMLWCIVNDLWIRRHIGFPMTSEPVVVCVADLLIRHVLFIVNYSSLDLFTLCRGWLLNMLWYIVDDLWIRRHVGFSMTYERVVMCVAVS